MSEANPLYLPPTEISRVDIPHEISIYLNGEDLATKNVALQLFTVDSDGWPHVALLSAGEILVLPDGHIRLIIFPSAGTATNMAHDGRSTLTMPLDRGMCEIRMKMRKLGESKAAGVALAIFEGQVQRIHKHLSRYADVESGLTFSLHEPEAVLARWYRQIAVLRNLPAP
ncbi:hypothetical protein SAMN05216315_107102 [Nitrosospira sp. Nsp18]|uniref:hypothetical protein n=1 Tax=Nitrosospira sp. Nsp18 TaxID=1855334 RepID=UPI00088F00D2|nr:hypothetical protein [Nitrosospira sp. Nsp18]SDA16355.1 hypothetical protein SAMN05216315_107102 [Nitrosospira sp. Nsp18]